MSGAVVVAMDFEILKMQHEMARTRQRNNLCSLSKQLLWTHEAKSKYELQQLQILQRKSLNKASLNKIQSK